MASGNVSYILVSSFFVFIFFSFFFFFFFTDITKRPPENTMSTRSKTPTVGLSEAEMLERARKRKQAASASAVTPSSMGAPKIARTAPNRDPKPVKTPLGEGETFTISLPKNFCEITAPTIFPSAEKLAFPAPQRRLASLPLLTVANEGLALQIHASQHSLALRSAALTLEKECKTLREKLDRSSASLTAAEKKVTELSEELAKRKARMLAM
ncbi:uncharacterized protein LOC104896955 [Beta vulgaris subsp. vulgaris]|uniref:uncharacterized protein LOC104896955 n=1 Tax=Beta vulgaris subsp. vulgaris TaxID=3555 RepID=UPI00254861AA|nr:uncharacterized protein LOC104896955 [Beta vulgaris subsp. vulgaris]